MFQKTKELSNLSHRTSAKAGRLSMSRGKRDSGCGTRSRDAQTGVACSENLDGTRLKSPGTHTPPHRLSADSDARVSQFADWKNRDARLEGPGQGQKGDRRFKMTNGRDTLGDDQSAIASHESQITSGQSTIGNRKSPIPQPRPPASSPQSQLLPRLQRMFGRGQSQNPPGHPND
jgi:hypothetical protein